MGGGRGRMTDEEKKKARERRAEERKLNFYLPFYRKKKARGRTIKNR